MSDAALASSMQGQLAAQPFTSTSPNAASGKSAETLSQFGADNVAQAIANVVGEYLSSAVGAMIGSSDMPQFMKDESMARLEQIVDQFTGDVAPGAQKGTEEALEKRQGSNDDAAAGGKDDVMDNVMDTLRSSMSDEMGNASKGSSDGAGKGGQGNWLAVLARALGDVAGKHLEKMVELGSEMGELDSTENPEQFAQFQSEFQAESQIFKMFQEAIGTMVKSIGEGMSTVARKQ